MTSMNAAAAQPDSRLGELLHLLHTSSSNPLLSSTIQRTYSILQHALQHRATLNTAVYPALPLLLDRIYVDIPAHYGECWLKASEYACTLLAAGSSPLHYITHDLQTLAPTYTLPLHLFPAHIQHALKHRQIQSIPQYYHDKVRMYDHYTAQQQLQQLQLQLNVNPAAAVGQSQPQSMQQSHSSSMLGNTLSAYPSQQLSTEVVELTLNQYFYIRFALFVVHNIFTSSTANSIGGASSAVSQSQPPISSTAQSLTSSLSSLSHTLIPGSHTSGSAVQSSAIEIERRTLARYRLLLNQYLAYCLPHRQHHNTHAAQHPAATSTPANIASAAARTVRTAIAQPLLGDSSSLLQHQYQPSQQGGAASQQQPTHQHNHSAADQLQIASNLLHALSELWLSQNAYIISAASVADDLSFKPPSTYLLHCIRDTVVHILRDSDVEFLQVQRNIQQQQHSLAHSIPTYSLGQQLFIGRPLFRFLHTTLVRRSTRWDQSLTQLIDIYCDVLQPWRILAEHNAGVGDSSNRHTTSEALYGSTLSKLGSAITKVSERVEHIADRHAAGGSPTIVNARYTPEWRPYVVENFLHYTIILRDLLQLVTDVEVIHPANSAERLTVLRQLERVFSIFADDSSLLSLLRDMEVVLLRQVRGAAMPLRTTANGVTEFLQQGAQVIAQNLSYWADMTLEQYVPTFNELSTAVQQPKLQHQQSASLAQPRHMRQLSTVSQASTQSHHRRDSTAATHTPLNGGMEFVSLRHTLKHHAPAAINGSHHASNGTTQLTSFADQSQPVLRNGRNLAIELLNTLQATPTQSTINVHGTPAYDKLEQQLRVVFELQGQIPITAQGQALRDQYAQQQQVKHASLHATPAAYQDPLQPEYDSTSNGTPSLLHRTTARLTTKGREQLRLGQALCNKQNIPVLGNPLYSLPVTSSEIPMLVQYAQHWSLYLNQKYQLPKIKGGLEVNLRPLANTKAVICIVALLLMLLRWAFVTVLR